MYTPLSIVCIFISKNFNIPMTNIKQKHFLKSTLTHTKFILYLKLIFTYKKHKKNILSAKACYIEGKSAVTFIRNQPYPK